MQLKQLEDDSNPSFLKEVLEMYLSDSKNRLQKMDEILMGEEPNYTLLESVVHQMKGSSARYVFSLQAYKY